MSCPTLFSPPQHLRKCPGRSLRRTAAAACYWHMALQQPTVLPGSDTVPPCPGSQWQLLPAACLPAASYDWSPVLGRPPVSPHIEGGLQLRV